MANIKYNSKVHDYIVWMLKSCGINDKLIAEKLEINPCTLYNWLKKHESFRDNYEGGNLLANARVQHSLYNRALGYEIKEADTKISRDLKGKIKSITVTEKTKHIPGDVQAQMFWLKNRMSEQWKDKVELANEGDDGLVQSLIEQIKGIDLESLEEKEKLEKEAD